MIDPLAARAYILIIGMDGCPACDEYLPRYREVAARHPMIPTSALEANTYSALADLYKVHSTPTTLLLTRRSGGPWQLAWRAEGGIPSTDLERVFEYAEKLP